jgi:phosphoglucosamine mutase
VLLNVRVREKADLKTVPEVAEVIGRVEHLIGGNGRLLVRYSGTEPLLRVMIEGQKKEEITKWASDIVDVVKGRLG